MEPHPPPHTTPLLDIRALRVHFPLHEGLLRRVRGAVYAVSDVSLRLKAGEVFGLVGESGCGKTTLGRAIVGLSPITAGDILLHDKPLVGPHGLPIADRSRKVQLVFQDPQASLHPRKVVRDLVGEGLVVHDLAHGIEVDARVLAILERVGLGLDHLYRYTHEFSGGQRQRIALARALILQPELLVLDEPTSALDVSVQAQILNLLKELRAEFGLTYLFISHDLGVVRYMSDRIGVMYLGNLVEVGPTDALFSASQHPYTRVLLSSLPSVDPDAKPTRILLQGDPPTPINPPPGCPFASRCPEVQPRCYTEQPDLVPRGADPLHLTACHRPNLP